GVVHPPISLVLWSPPLEGIMKINFDGGDLKGSKCSSIGIVVRALKGNFIIGYCRKLEGIVRVEHVEAATAVRLTTGARYTKIILEGDYRVITNGPLVYWYSLSYEGFAFLSSSPFLPPTKKE
ncbi:unnamed protein product, partial [Ilex paraguariensis]